jgi:hypothetical protein
LHKRGREKVKGRRKMRHKRRAIKVGHKKSKCEE